MATYEQELAEWEAKRKEAWNRFYDGCISSSSIDCVDYADDGIEAWERRYPRPEQPSPGVQKLETAAPDRIGCQDLTYTKKGVRTSNGGWCPIQGLKNLKDYACATNEAITFYGVCGYSGTYHNGYITIDGQTVTTAQLAAMIARCEALAREPEVDLSKRWKVVHCGYNNEHFADCVSAENFGTQGHPPAGFATKEEAEAFASSKDRVCERCTYMVMPYLATKLPEKRWQVWWKHILGTPKRWREEYSGGEYEYKRGGVSSKAEAERVVQWNKDNYGHLGIQLEIREVEVYE